MSATEPILAARLESGGPAGVLGPLVLTVAPGETLALTGPSGIGKTTLLRILAGLERRFVGELRLGGRLAMVFQAPVLLPWRTARQNLTLVAGVSMAEAEHWLDRVGLAFAATLYPGQLSLGQQRRLALARAFATRPDILLMDEPFVSLDSALAEEMIALYEELRGQRPLATLLVTHAAAEAERLADRVLALTGRPAQLLSVQKAGAYLPLSASGVTTSRS